MEIIDVNEILNSLDIQKVKNIEKEVFYKWNDLSSQKELFYYIDTNAFINGVLSEVNVFDKGICLWASRWSHLNDSSENLIGFNLMKKMNTPSNIIKQVKSNLLLNHSVSFSAEQDSLPMWKMYGDGGYGVMLVFDCQKLLDFFDARLQYCIYRKSEYDKYYTEKMTNLDFGDYFKQLTIQQKQYITCILFQIYCSIVKNEKYSYEKEIRIVGCGNPFFDNNNKTVFYRYAKSSVIPYVKVYLPKNSLKRVCLGPLLNVDLSKSSIGEYLHSKGLGDVEVCVSKVPYRG